MNAADAVTRGEPAAVELAFRNKTSRAAESAEERSAGERKDCVCAVSAAQTETGEWISRNAELRIHTDSFEHGRTNINQIAAAHHGFLEHLVTESHSGRGRALRCVLDATRYAHHR